MIALNAWPQPPDMSSIDTKVAPSVSFNFASSDSGVTPDEAAAMAALVSVSAAAMDEDGARREGVAIREIERVEDRGALARCTVRGEDLLAVRIARRVALMLVLVLVLVVAIARTVVALLRRATCNAARTCMDEDGQAWWSDLWQANKVVYRSMTWEVCLKSGVANRPEYAVVEWLLSLDIESNWLGNQFSCCFCRSFRPSCVIVIGGSGTSTSRLQLSLLLLQVPFQSRALCCHGRTTPILTTMDHICP